MRKNNLINFLIGISLIISVRPFYPALTHAGTIVDDFAGASLIARLWWPYHTDQNQRCLQQGGVLKIQIDGASQGSTGSTFGAGIGSCFDLKGDFEIVADYNLAYWPYSNGVGAGIMFSGIDSPGSGGMTRRSFGADEPSTTKECYVTDFVYFQDANFLDHAQVSTSHSQGKMKLTRVGQLMTGYFWQNNTWQKVGSHDYSGSVLGDWLTINLGAFSQTVWIIPNGQVVHPFAGKDVEIDFDNWQITYDQIRYYPSGGPAPGILLLLHD